MHFILDGGHVKYGFPTAATLSLLAWGAIEFKRGYVASKELGNLLAAIKWGTDYLLKCHTSPHEFYGQVVNFFHKFLFPVFTRFQPT